jgi:hypothetical protein
VVVFAVSRVGCVEDVLDLGVVVERVRAELAADARLLEAAERGETRTERFELIESTPVSIARATRSALAPSPRPDRAGEAVDGVVGDRDRLALAVERDARGDRAEDLLARGAVVVGDRARTVGGNQYPGPSGAVPRKATGASSLRRRRPSRAGRPRSAPHRRAVGERVAHPDLLDRRSHQLEEAVEHGALDEDPRARAAVLARVAKTAPGAPAAAFSRSASRRSPFADLPPSSRSPA